MKLRCLLYKLAVWYIGKCNKKWEKERIGHQLKELKRLTYHNIDKAYLSYGADAEWQNFSRYEVLNYAIQKLAMYEDQELNNNYSVEKTFPYIREGKEESKKYDPYKYAREFANYVDEELNNN